MLWGNFTPAHILSIFAAAAMIAGLYLLLRRRSQKCQVWTLGILSFSGIAAIVYNLLMWGEPLAYLPLELCSVNALVLPYAVFSRKKVPGNLLLVWSLGALMAIVVNNEMAAATLFDWPFNFYYFPHVLEFGIPILLFKLGLVEKDPRCIGSTIGITMGVYTLAHCANLIINSCTDVDVNYMFSVNPNFNPATALFYRLLPYEYWYMYAVLPIVALYLAVIYLPQIRRSLQLRKIAKAAV